MISIRMFWAILALVLFVLSSLGRSMPDRLLCLGLAALAMALLMSFLH